MVMEYWSVEQAGFVMVGSLLLMAIHLRWPLPWKSIWALLGNAVSILRRNKWIFVVFLVGIGVNSLLSESTVLLADFRYRQLHPDASTRTAYPDVAGAFSIAFHWGWRLGLARAAGILSFLPIELYSSFLAFFCLLRWRKKVRTVVFGNQATSNKMQSVIWAFILLGGIASLIYPFTYPLANEPAFRMQWMIISGSLGVIFTWFAGAFLTALLIRSAEMAVNGGSMSIRDLLEIDTIVFKRLLVFNLMVFGVAGGLQIGLILLPRQFERWNMLSEARWMTQAQGIGLNCLLPTIQIAILLVPLLIVLRGETIRNSFRHDFAIWSNHFQPMLALILTLLLVAVLMHVSEFAIALEVSQIPKSISRFGFSLIDAVLSPIWLIATVRLLNQIQPANVFNNPGIRS
jgi:hypothetical protein